MDEISPVASPPRRFSALVLKGSLKAARAAYETAPGLSILVLTLVVIRASLSVAFLLTAGVLIGEARALTGSDLSFNSAGVEDLLRALVFVISLFLIGMVGPPFEKTLSESLGRKVDDGLRARLMAAVSEPTGIAHLERPGVADQVFLAEGVGPGKWTPGDAVVGLADNLGTRLSVLGAALVLASFRWWAGLLVVGGGFILRSRLVAEGSKRLKVLIGEAQEMRRADYVRDLILTPQAAKETRIFALSGWIQETFTDLWVGVMGGLWKARNRDAGAVLPFFLPVAAATAFALYAGGAAAISGEISLEAAVTLSLAVLAAGQWTVTNSDLLIEYGAAAIDPAIELEKAASDPAARLMGNRSADGMPESQITFESVSFRYPGREADVFRQLDLEIPAGKSLAIVGPNGAGKTTFVKLLTRLHDPTGGTIRVDGVALTEIDPKQWRRRIAAIFQDFVPFELSAADNVRFGDVSLVADPEGALDRSAERVGVDFISELPHGWETILSRRYEKGTDLSGGQWQRIALARALYAVGGGASLLILDEPTANLDVKAEAELFEKFLELTAGLTTILISHRFSSVRRAESIVVLGGGGVVEQGSHDDLMRLGGEYSKTFELQASRFKEVEKEPGGA